MIGIDDIRKLREETGLSVGLCKSTLEEAGGDVDKAISILRSKGAVTAEKKASRTLGAGRIVAYVHTTGALGAMVELDSETDFVARNEEFMTLAKDIAMHVTVNDPADVATLLEQPFVKDDTRTVRQLIEAAIQKFGEKIELVRFVRFSALH